MNEQKHKNPYTQQKKVKDIIQFSYTFFSHLNMEFNTQTQTMNNDLNNEQFQQPNDKNQKT